MPISFAEGLSHLVTATNTMSEQKKTEEEAKQADSIEVIFMKRSLFFFKLMRVHGLVSFRAAC